MISDFSAERLADLLLEPSEEPNCEIKNWLNLRENDDHKATFAKAVLALANHGGGFVLLGLVKDGLSFVEAPDRPQNLDQYGTDLVNGIVRNYCEPAFHCSVHQVANPAGVPFPVIVVPGDHKVPVQSRRAGPNGNTVSNHTVYIRKPGPRSEPPLTGQEWDELFKRCMANRRNELADQIRDIVRGTVAKDMSHLTQQPFDAWIEDCLVRWRELVGGLPLDSAARCNFGYFWIAYKIDGNLRDLSLAQLDELVRVSRVNHTGWPPFIYANRDGIAPYPRTGAVECWLGGDTQSPLGVRDAAHADFWRISQNGFAFQLRGYQEDSPEVTDQGNRVAPSTLFDLCLPAWRVGEAILHARQLSNNLADGPATIHFVANYQGLNGRQLASLSPGRDLFERRQSHQDSIRLESSFPSDSVDTNLPEIVGPMLAPLYSLFDFFEPPAALVSQELERMRSGRF